jgi:hypothetical protein
VVQYPGSAVRPYDEARAPQENADGSFSVMVGITPPKDANVNGGIVAICTMTGTAGTPKLAAFTLKDI